MPLDVRLPISGLFLAVGVLLLAYGAGVEGVGTSAGKLNAIWGAVMLIFGVGLGYYGMRNERRSRSIAEGGPTPPGPR
jgi:phosphotransferase system  glucose/maltose/N-acetylglucosamine-specific IIC component